MHVHVVVCIREWIFETILYDTFFSPPCCNKEIIYIDIWNLDQTVPIKFEGVTNTAFALIKPILTRNLQIDFFGFCIFTLTFKKMFCLFITSSVQVLQSEIFVFYSNKTVW